MKLADIRLVGIKEHRVRSSVPIQYIINLTAFIIKAVNCVTAAEIVKSANRLQTRRSASANT